MSTLALHIRFFFRKRPRHYRNADTKKRIKKRRLLVIVATVGLASLVFAVPAAVGAGHRAESDADAHEIAKRVAAAYDLWDGPKPLVLTVVKTPRHRTCEVPELELDDLPCSTVLGVQTGPHETKVTVTVGKQSASVRVDPT